MKRGVGSRGSQYSAPHTADAQQMLAGTIYRAEGVSLGPRLAPIGKETCAGTLEPLTNLGEAHPGVQQGN